MTDPNVLEIVLYWNGSLESPEFWTTYQDQSPGILSKVTISPLPIPTGQQALNRAIKASSSQSKRLSKEFKKLQRVIKNK